MASFIQLQYFKAQLCYNKPQNFSFLCHCVSTPWTYEHLCACFCVDTGFCYIACAPGSGVTGSWENSTCNFWRTLQTVFQNSCVILYSHCSTCRFLFLPIFSSGCYCLCFHPNVRRAVAHGFDMPFPVANAVAHLSGHHVSLGALCIFGEIFNIFGEIFKSLAHFSFRLSFCWSIIKILYIKAPIWLWFASTCSLSVGYIFTFLVLPIEA